MQTECYTPVKNATPGELGLVPHVVRLIHKIKPQIITISEAKIAAIEDPNSNFSKMINQLERMGYKITHKATFKNDEEAEELMEVYREFTKTFWIHLHVGNDLKKML